ncbi:MAG: hypothetical protein AAF668_03985 [Pseudomonadota bacterium]
MSQPDQSSNRKRRLKSALRDVAPEIARALGGPLAGAAVEALSKAVLGGDGTMKEEELAAALENADPEVLLRIKQAEFEFRRAIVEAHAAAQTEALSIASSDRADARRRESQLKDRTPSILGGLILAGFFLVLGAMVLGRLPEGAETEFSIMLGALATMTAAVVNYYFGSSVGSREKTRLLSPFD